jgi:hypothetical protein
LTSISVSLEGLAIPYAGRFFALSAQCEAFRVGDTSLLRFLVALPWA